MTNKQNYFTMFDIPQSVFIDIKTLDKSYITLQKKYHPNRHTQNQFAQMKAVQQSSIINDAYQLLLNPAKRVQHLLGLLGGDNLPKAAAYGTEFLFKMIELRESAPAESIRKIDVFIMVLLKKISTKLEDAMGNNSWQEIVDINERIVFLANMKKHLHDK